MKVDTLWRRRAAVNVADGSGYLLVFVYAWVLSVGLGAEPLGPSDRPEAYFNGSSYIHLSRPISLKQLVGLSFRTCVGGELFSQRFERYTLHVVALYEQVVVSWTLGAQSTREVGLPKETLDNRWHWVALRYRPNPPALLLEVDNHTQVIANVTWNPELLSAGALEAGGAVVLVGNLFSGCIHEGPQLEFHAHSVHAHNVLFAHCPLTTDECKDRVDVLRIPPKDHCYNEPCMRHGTCISRHDRYECHCTARYTGNNCEVDAGDPCRSAPCAHGGSCRETPRGDYLCHCPPAYHGAHCELEVSMEPECVAAPCHNNGSCSVPPGAGHYVCACPAGFTGRQCESEIDECAEAGPHACLNNGRCIDAVNNYTCDCTDTGYTGPRCEVNINECEAEGGEVCGAGVCYDTYGGYVCACQPGYTGERCHTLSACASGPCGLGGACVEEGDGAGFRCVCARGFLPPLCTARAPAPAPAPAGPDPAPADVTPAACADVVCPPRSHCASALPPGMPTTVTGVMINKPVTCVCDAGYYGLPGPQANCSAAAAACEAAVCLHGATCRAHDDRLDCVCPPHYKGTYCEVSVGAAAGAGAGAARGLSELKAERCAASPPPCVHAKACHDRPSGFRCECEAGWTGPRCDVPAGAGAGAGAGAECGCLNGGVCREDGACDCRPGYAGAQCEAPMDCRASSCPMYQECVEQAGAWRCAAAGAESACASAPCHNGTCVGRDHTYFCQCAPGSTGRLCELDIDECARSPKICNNGVCVNVPGSYQCYCRPGYTGDSCEQDIDECLSSPCKNGGTCLNLENNYECTCMEGFEGKDCSVNIDECSTSPCAAGSTCVDGVAAYTCVCRDGLTGARCEQDIDDCESAPCLHGGRCVDLVNGYSCECAGTGYGGVQCELDIDECAPQPCQHGGTCLDALNDYRCTCHPGYTGKNCETDVEECASSPCKHGGVCVERSNASLYQRAEAPPLQVGPQPEMVLPASFYRPFTYQNASGFECVCVSGTEGARCEVNVDECASSPCGHGACVDGVGGYSCECSPGYEGAHCELEIDECQRYQPCAHGRCHDARAAYYCSCAAGWGGRNCSVVLTGCSGAPCRNHGTCRAWLRGETDHRFNCSCAPGYYGTTCQRITTMSLEKSSYAEVNTTREEGYDISFRFKTTLGSGLLAMGRGLTYFFLELSNGRLNLHSSLLNKWEGVFIGSNLNDSNWQKVFVTINSSHLVLAANEEQTIYPISQNEAYNSSVTSFPSTRLGAPGSSYATLTHGPNFFVGCVQDVVVNGQWVLPDDDANDTSSEADTEPSVEGGAEAGEGGEGAEVGGGGGGAQALHGVTARCPRRAQCAPNPCRSGGACEDRWSSFLCACPRPYLGATCQYNYTAATFGHEAAAPRSVVAVAVAAAARRAVHAALDISMFVRTRKPTGQIFYLGSLPREGAEETQVSASLFGGELLVHLRFNQTSENYTVGGTRLDNGYLHLIQVVRNATLVQVKLNGTEYFRKSISAAKQLDAEVLYLGGPPPPPSDGPAGAAEPDDAAYFKGVIQDVQVSNGVNVTIVEFFPLEVSGVELPPPFGAVQLDARGVVRGVVTDDACASGPCLHNASCANTWNDYSCDCPRGYKGKQCAEVEFCQLQGCPLNSHCRNLDAGYECVSNATFDGVNTTLAYQLRVPRSPPLAPAAPPTPPDSLTITYRTKVGGTLFHARLAEEEEGGAESWFTVSVVGAAVGLQWRGGGGAVGGGAGAGAGLPRVRRLTAPRALAWTTLRLTVHRDKLTGSFVEAEGHEEASLEIDIDVEWWQRLLLHGQLYLGGKGPRAPPPTTPSASPPSTDTSTAVITTPAQFENSTDMSVWEYTEGDEFASENSAGLYFKGCIGAVHVGSLLLPFFTEEQLFVGSAAGLLALQPHYALVSGRAWGAAENVGCVLCLEAECQRGGRCADVRNSYACSCPKGLAGDYCQIDIDECAEHQCQNGATCLDGVASYTCICPEGFEGDMCEVDIDECASMPCQNGGTCRDGRGGYTCACPPGHAPPHCARPLRRACRDRPCVHARACIDLPPEPPTGNNYTCECAEGFEGAHCETPFCERTPCVHGDCRVEGDQARCECHEGYGGRLCSAEADACADVAACAHGGRCVRRARGHVCDCQGTGWTGARCEVDVDECGSGLVSCGPGECVNLDGSYKCICAEGFCGVECAVRDPCFLPGPEVASAEAAGPGVAGNRTLGPCLHGAECAQACTHVPAYQCRCTDGWAGQNCEHQAVPPEAEAEGGGNTSSVLIGVGAALLALAAAGAALAALAAQARRKRATRGTYSPSGQEYCNPRAHHHHALKPPPEERLI